MTFEAFGWFAAATSGLRSVPQLVRMRRQGTSSGVSAASMAFTSMNGLAWVIWSANTGNTPVLVSSGLTFVGFLEVARRSRRSISMNSRVMLGLGLSLYAGALLLFGPVALGVLGSAGSTVQFLPQAREILRTADRSGVAPGTYALSTINELSWLTYAFVTREPLLAIPYLVRLPTSLYILALASGRRRPPPDGPTESSTDLS